MTTGGVTVAVINPPREAMGFTWTIPDFELAKTSAEYLEDNRRTFDLGRGIDFPVTFDLSLLLDKDEQGQRWVSLELRVIDKSEPAAHVMARFQLKIGNYLMIETGIVDLSPSQLVWPILPQNEDVKKLPLTPDGGLPLQLVVTLYNMNMKAPRPTTALEELLLLYQQIFRQQLSADLEKVVHQPGMPKVTLPLDLTVVSGEGRELKTNASLLAARSPVLKSMLEQGAVRQGVLRMSKMRGTALEVLLQFLHTATLNESWREMAILKQLAIAAKEYQVMGLLEFLDEALEMVATPDNSGHLLLLANAAGLKKAKGAMLDQYRRLWKEGAHNPVLKEKLLNEEILIAFEEKEDTNEYIEIG